MLFSELFLTALFESALLIFVFMIVGFVIASLKEDNSIVDIMWGLGFVLVAAYTFFKFGNDMPKQFLVTSLILLWGMRLSSHIFVRKWGKPEDPRYTNFRKGWGRHQLLGALLQVFMLQGALLLMVALPAIIINSSSVNGFTWIDYLAILIWLIGFFFEVVGDYQLEQFKIMKKESSKKHALLTTGLWKYTRHPNYFGEVTQWWGIFLIAVQVSWLSIISPITITILILFVSGVPMLERHFEGRKGWEEYKARTNKFFPWMPRVN